MESGIVPPEPPAAQTTRRPVPMIGRKPGNDSRPTETKPAAAANTVAGPGAAIDRAREANKAREQAPGRSLRHTGLLRPVSNQDTLPAGYKPDISPATETDSATEDAGRAVNESVTRDHEAQGESKPN
ncbi:hypothetical protein D3C86_1728740 [compost metagenome]